MLTSKIFEIQKKVKQNIVKHKLLHVYTRIYGTSKVSSLLFILHYCTTELLLTPLSVFKTNQTHHRLIFVVGLEIVVVVDLVDILKVVLHVQQHHEQN